MRRARFVAAARAEFLAEVAYYNQAAPGQGARFVAAVEEATARALTFPLSGSPLEPNLRRVVVICRETRECLRAAWTHPFSRVVIVPAG